MTSKRYVITTIAVTLLLAAGVVATNLLIDPFGLFGDERGAQRAVVYNERMEKFLFSFNYIPANFDALLVGPSVSANLDSSRLSGHRVYNASLSGGNISELRLIVDNALERGHIDTVVLCLYTYLVKTHGQKTSHMTDASYWAALGSWDLIKYYYMRLKIEFGLSRPTQNAFGYDRYSETAPKADVAAAMEKRIALTRRTDERLIVDKVAMDELGDFITDLKARGVRIVPFFYPVYNARYNTQKEQYEALKTRWRAMLGPEVSVVDFMSDDARWFTADIANYHDISHLSKRGADRLLVEIQKALDTPQNADSN